jgi:hypothetical protein
MDFLTPLAASVVCREGGLPPEDSIAMTAASLVIQGPLALAPAIIAVENHRASGKRPPTPSGEIGPALVKVPDVVGKSEENAIRGLESAKLRWDVRYNRATDDASVGQVVRQSPSGTSNELVPENTIVELNVAKVRLSTPVVEEQVTDAELKASLAEVEAKLKANLESVKTAVDAKLTEMNVKLDRVLELHASSARGPTKA